MPDQTRIHAALEALAPGRVQSLRVDGERVSAILDATGLSGEGP